VYEMMQACYCCWFNWKKSITCTHCNVISLEHDSIPWQAKSQRINVNTTTFHLLWQLFTIIKIFSSTFELDWKIWLPRTNQILTVYVLLDCIEWFGKFQGDIIQQHNINHTLSHHCVIWRFTWSRQLNIQAEKCGEKEDPKPSITSLNITNTCDGYDFNIDIINKVEYNALQKESLMLFEGFCIFGFREFFKTFFCILMEVNKTMYGNNEDVPKMFFDNLYPESHLCDVCVASGQHSTLNHGNRL
jgi:hypothetical protein